MKQTLLFIILNFLCFSEGIAQNLVPVGNGINSSYGIYSGTVVYNNKIYATDGSVIYVWDGSNWSSLVVNANSNIMCLEVYNGKLYVAGWFTDFNGIAANRIISYDGTNWSPLGSGIHVDPNVTGGVEKMAVYNNELIVLGGLIQAGSVTANRIAKWNGSTWSTLGSGLGYLASIPSMLTYNNELYVFSQINVAGGVQVNNAAKWNGISWSGVGNGLSKWPISSVVYNNNINVGQWISSGDNSSTISKWDGTSWSPVETNLNDSSWTIPMDLKVFNGCLYVAGMFSNINGVPVNSLARFDGNNWFPVANGVDNTAAFLTEYNNELYVTGRFQYSGNVAINNIAKIQGAPSCILLGTTTATSNISIYPNPASDFLQIKTDNKQIEKNNYKIYNSVGQCENYGTTINNQISIASLKKGLYVICIEIDGSVRNFKFIKE